MTGKEKCEMLRSIRKNIADANGIDYKLEECHNEGECQGTCPKCDAEILNLESELHKKAKRGEKITVTGDWPVIEDFLDESSNSQVVVYFRPYIPCTTVGNIDSPVPDWLRDKVSENNDTKIDDPILLMPTPGVIRIENKIPFLDELDDKDNEPI